MKNIFDVLIVAHYTQLPGEESNGRFHYIAEKIDITVADIEIVSTSYSHSRKRQRKVNNQEKTDVNYKMELLYEPGYKKNVSVGRLFSHFIFGKSLKKYLCKRRIPDVIYCAIPSLSAAKVASEYARKHNVRYIIDIQDLWPEAFGMVIKSNIFSQALFRPMRILADKIYKRADEVIAVSQSYVDRALQVNKRVKSGHCVYLGTELVAFDELRAKNLFSRKFDGEVWLAYVGTLSHSYDIVTVIDAIKLLQEEGIDNIRFIVIGDGPMREEFEKYAKDQKIIAKFVGRLPYGEMVGLLSVCDMAVNPIVQGSRASIINKHADYSAAGLPVLNTQESQEYRNLLVQFKAGLNCNVGDSVDLAHKLKTLYSNEELRVEMGQNSRRMAEEMFDRGKTYEIINKLIMEQNDA